MSYLNNHYMLYVYEIAGVRSDLSYKYARKKLEHEICYPGTSEYTLYENNCKLVVQFIVYPPNSDDVDTSRFEDLVDKWKKIFREAYRDGKKFELWESVKKEHNASE